VPIKHIRNLARHFPFWPSPNYHSKLFATFSYTQRLQPHLQKQTLKVTMECGMRVLPGQTERSFATRVSQLKICDFSGETFKGFEVL